MSRAAWLACIALTSGFLVAAVGCQGKRTETVIRIWAEPGVTTRGQALDVVLSAGTGVDPTGYVVTAREHFDLSSDGLGLPIDIAIVPADGDASRHFALVASMIDGDGAIVGQSRVTSGFIEGRTTLFDLLLADGCLGVVCPPAQTCIDDDATCVDAFVDPALLGELTPRPEPTPLDAGVDPSLDGGGPPIERDGGTPPPTCVSAAECDDGNPCTDDACDLTSCVHLPNTAACDDGVPCSHDDACHDGTCTGVAGCLVGTCSRLTGMCECAPGVPGCGP